MLRRLSPQNEHEAQKYTMAGLTTLTAARAAFRRYDYAQIDAWRSQFNTLLDSLDKEGRAGLGYS